MMQILAIAQITFREAIRSKALIIPFVFGLAVLASAPFTPAFSSPDRLKIMISVASAAISLLAALIAIFISTTTMTSEIKDKRIFTVLTRSIGRFQFVLGKILGVWFTLAMLLLVLGGISYLILQVSGTILLNDVQKGNILSSNRPVLAQDIDYYKRDIKVKRYQAEKREYERILKLSTEMYAKGHIPEGIKFKDIIAFMGQSDEQIAIESPGIDPTRMKEFYAVILTQLTHMDFGTNAEAWKIWYENNPGFGKHPKNPDLAVELFSGDDEHVFTWAFSGLEEEALKDSLRFQIIAAVYANPRSRRFTGARSRKPIHSADIDVLVSWKDKKEQMKATVTHLEQITLVLDENRPAPGEPFFISIRARQGPASIIVTKGSVQALLESGSFLVNLLKSLMLSWSLAALLAAVGIFGSCFLSFPVALLLCVFVFFWGSTSGYLKDLTREPSGNPLVTGVIKDNPHKRKDLISEISDKFYNGANLLGNCLAKGIDDFSHFDGAKYLPESKEISWNLVSKALLKLLAWRAILLVLVGWFFFRFREF